MKAPCSGPICMTLSPPSRCGLLAQFLQDRGFAAGMGVVIGFERAGDADGLAHEVYSLAYL